mgnify:CR=1 FL=1
MCHKISIKVNSEITASEQVMSWFEQLNHPPIPDEVIWWECQTILHEGFANMVEHAHKNLPPETPIRIEAERCDRYIEFRIWSCGQIFDLERKLREIPELEDNDSEGGRGLKIMEKMADYLSYERTADNCNCLRMKKYY